MRDYLRLSEIQKVLENQLHLKCEVDEIMEGVFQEAATCLCDARSWGECTCGAWEIEDVIDFED